MSQRVQYLQDACEAVASKLPDNHGFVLIVVPCGSDNTIARYASNLSREDALRVIKEMLFRWGEDESWMTDVR